MDNINNEIKIKYLDSILIEDSESDDQLDAFNSSILESYDNQEGGVLPIAAAGLVKVFAGPVAKKLMGQAKVVAKQVGKKTATQAMLTQKSNIIITGQQMIPKAPIDTILKATAAQYLLNQPNEGQPIYSNTNQQDQIIETETYDGFKQNIINSMNNRIEYNKVKHSQTSDIQMKKEISAEMGKLKKDYTCVQKCLQNPTKTKKGGGYSELSETAINNNLNNINDELNQLFSLLKY